MKSTVKPLLFIVLAFFCIKNVSYAQNVGIGSTAFTPDPSAGLELLFSDKGFLMPRLSEADKATIPAPIAEYLIILNTTSKCIEIYDDNAWRSLSCWCTGAPSAPTAGVHTPTDTDIEWHWNAGSGASGYKWNTINDFASSTDIGNVTSYTQTGLSCNSSYTIYIWAYNNCGHSSALTLTQQTAACPFTCGSTVNDINGNTYNTVQIGTQCWLKENLKVTKYQNGDNIPLVTGNTEWDALSSGAYCYYDNNSSNGNTYGAMYNWYAATDNRNICPTGWIVPSDNDWKTLELFLGLTQNQADAFDPDRGSNIRVVLSTTSGWYNNANGNNSTGFSAVPGGYREAPWFSNVTQGGYWWTSTEQTSSEAIFRTLYYFYGGIGRLYEWGFDKKTGFSVRCIKN